MISAHGLTKFYGENRAVHDVNFAIDTGEIVGILGLNGAGKSTTLRILSSLLLPTSGTVKVDDVDVVQNPDAVRKLIGFLPETAPLYTEMTVRNFLLFAGRLRGLSKSQARSRLDEVLKLTDLTSVADAFISSLSHGFRQRVGIAQAVIHNPPVLILDEPISGLDPEQIIEMRTMVRDLGGRHTVLISSHILSEISQTCDRILVIKDGEIVASGSEEELTASLSGGHRLYLVARGAKDQVLAAVRKVEGVKACGPVKGDHHPYRSASSASQESLVHLEVSSDVDIREELSRSIIQGGFGLLHLSPAESELESIFLQLTRRGSTAAPQQESLA